VQTNKDSSSDFDCPEEFDGVADEGGPDVIKVSSPMMEME
jgi:hypothetical protein